MSIFTSPPSDPTVALLWGDCWWTSESVDPICFGESAEAAAALIESLAPEAVSKPIRLIYQPDHLVSEAIECPNGNRATLQAALQADFPALADPQRAWSFEPINAGNNSTLLHYETQPELIGLVEALLTSGFEVEGVWPLASVLNYVPADWPETGALTVLAIAGHRTLVYRHTPAGIRQASTAQGDGGAELAATAIQQSHDSDTTAFYFVALDSSGEVLEPQIASWNPADRSGLKWNRLMEVTRTLPLTYPNQLIPPIARINAFRVATGLTTAALIVATLLVGQIGFTLLNQKELTDQQVAEIKVLSPEVARLKAQETQFKALRAELAKFESNSTEYSSLLKSVGQHLPPSLVLTRLQVDAAGFRLVGGVTDSEAADSEWSRWTGEFGSVSQPWTIAENRVEASAAEFQLKGIWR